MQDGFGLVVGVVGKDDALQRPRFDGASEECKTQRSIPGRWIRRQIRQIAFELFTGCKNTGQM
jgi:hypothetical protein